MSAIPVTYIIIGITVLISMTAFSNHELFHKMKHWPYAESTRGEWYRWISGGFLHGDFTHLLFNMLTLYFFGPRLEYYFSMLFPAFHNTLFTVFYLTAIVAASSGTYVRHKDNPGFASIGASGATAAVLFACILFDPTIGIGMFFIPIPIPGFIFGVLYLWYSAYSAQKGSDNIDHLAHYFGALFGFLFPMIFRPSLLLSFFAQIMDWISSF
jgi:membrane associated rhomboid family serine protease